MNKTEAIEEAKKRGLNLAQLAMMVMSMDAPQYLSREPVMTATKCDPIAGKKFKHRNAKKKVRK
jgi:hypothetical protein